MSEPSKVVRRNNTRSPPVNSSAPPKKPYSGDALIDTHKRYRRFMSPIDVSSKCGPSSLNPVDQEIPASALRDRHGPQTSTCRRCCRCRGSRIRRLLCSTECFRGRDTGGGTRSRAARIGVMLKWRGFRDRRPSCPRSLHRRRRNRHGPRRAQSHRPYHHHRRPRLPTLRQRQQRCYPPLQTILQCRRRRRYPRRRRRHHRIQRTQAQRQCPRSFARSPYDLRHSRVRAR